jgi:hypothetical protein
MLINFKSIELLLFDEYLIVKDVRSYSGIKERKIIKDDIMSFMYNQKDFTTTSYGGRVGGSVRVAKGVYIKTSTPYYNKNTNTKYSPYILLTSGEKIYLGDVFQFDTDFPILKHKIMKCNAWKNCSSIVELEEELEKEKKENIQKQNLELPLFWIWFAFFIYSIFTLNPTLIIVSIMSITYFMLISYVVDLIKNKRTTYAICLIIFIILSVIGLLLD